MPKSELFNFRVNAFTGRGLLGNPAGVCLATAPMSDVAMQAIAAENNLPETAFVQRRDDGAFDLRWFTPEVEVDLCGHATLAAAHVLVNEATPWVWNSTAVLFHTRSGILQVTKREGDLLELDLPSRPAVSIETPLAIMAAFDTRPLGCWMARDILVNCRMKRPFARWLHKFLF